MTTKKGAVHVRWLQAGIEGIALDAQQPDPVVTAGRGVTAGRLALSAAAHWPPPVAEYEPRDAVPAEQAAQETQADPWSAAALDRRVVFVAGPPGAGKSGLARARARRYREEHGFAWWIDACDESAVDVGLVRLALEVGGEQALDQDVRTLRALAERWLETHGDWLLVLDGVRHPAQVGGLTDRFPHGRFVITTRDAEPWRDAAFLIELPGPARGGDHDACADPRPPAWTGIEDAEVSRVLYARLPGVDAWAARRDPAEDSPHDAEMFAHLAQGLARAGDYPRALRYQERAARGLERHSGDADLDVLAAWNNVGCLLLGVDQPAAGSAIAILERVLPACESAAGTDSESAAVAARNLACACLRAADRAWRDPRRPAGTEERAFARREQAVTLLRRLLDRARRLHGDQDEATWRAQEDLAAAYHVCYQYRRFQTSGGVEEAARLLEDSWTWRMLSGGEDAPATLACQMKLGTALSLSVRAKDTQRAEPMLREAYDACLRLFGPHAQITLAAFMRLTGYQVEHLAPGAVDAGRLLYERCRRALGPTHALTAYAASLAWLAADASPGTGGPAQIEAIRRADALALMPPADRAPGVDLPPYAPFVLLVRGDVVAAARLFSQHEDCISEYDLDPDPGTATPGSPPDRSPDPLLDPRAAWIRPALDRMVDQVALQYRLAPDDPALIRARLCLAEAREGLRRIGELL